ncbi:Sec63 Brl domain-containing protein [Entophlyctis helioformis]|nr:Sec63 Brl domain-containing protein [Entophlyctis helioformis]
MALFPKSFVELLPAAAAAVATASGGASVDLQRIAPSSSSACHGQDDQASSDCPEFGMHLPFSSPLDRISRRPVAAPVDDSATDVDQLEIQEYPPAYASALSVKPDEETFDKQWLLRRCTQHLGMADSGNAHMSPEQLCIDVFSILRTAKNDDDIQNALVDLIGYSDFDFIAALLACRQVLVENVMLEALHRRDDLPGMARGGDGLPASQQRGPPSHGARVTVMSESEKQQLKAQRKERKKQSKMSKEEFDNTATASLLGFDGDHLRQARAEQLRAASNAPMASNKNPGAGADGPVYPNVFKSSNGGSTLSAFGTRFVLPPGTERVDEKDFEEITIPKRIAISTMEPFAQLAFNNYDSLNRVQSIVFPVAYETSENMLVCAPTGAGKTDIAMLTVLRTVSQHFVDGVLQHDKFKIVYVAPMKALAAEIVRKFSSRLAGLQVRWDVVTRKSVGDTELAQKVKLLIIDEVHLLHEGRGAVIESIVARTLRLVESSQSLIRVVGLSATLPNYVDVAMFLGVNPYVGLFFFDAGFRPVPLEQHFIGVKAKAGSTICQSKMNQICYDHVVDLVRGGHQVMVFVHARKETVRTAQTLREEALNTDEIGLFDCSEDPQFGIFLKEVQKSKNKELKELFASGFGIHHAGMLRSDRTLTERMFEKGLLKVLCCTATLAWGVNLPAYAVVIKGTQVYNADKGAFVDLSILDVLQIFGRAGRPQYEDRGVGYIITTHDKLNHYVSAMTQQHPIESTFSEKLVDNLNAEISLGTVTNLDEAVKWLSYTYLYVRMRKNPFQYGLDWKEVQDDPHLGKRRRDLLVSAGKVLHKTQMVVFDERTGYLTPKDLSRIASNYYISHSTIEIFNTMMRPQMTEADVLSMLSMSSEFENIKSRNEEMTELKGLLANECACAVKGGIETNYGKANILLQSYISRAYIDDFALVSDTAYVAQNSSRILRALFEIAMSRNWGPTATVILSLCKTVDRRMWSYEHPLGQFDLSAEILGKLEKSYDKINMESMRDMNASELGDLVRHHRMGDTIYRCVHQFPSLHLEATIAPITRTVLRVTLNVTADFMWSEKVHGKSEPWWIWVEGPENTEILYSEYLLIHRRNYQETQKLGFTIPIPRSTTTTDGLPPQIYIRATSDRWIGAENIIPVSFKHLILPELNRAPHTDLLDLQPLPISALENPVLEEICRKRFQYFNPVQTQIFHTLYRTQHNALIGAPTGSGKTVAAELAMWSAFRDFPKSKVVYIAPLKALVRERVQDWRARLTDAMGRKLVELTGDVTPDLETIQSADIIITTPEKWDGVSRSWQTRKYVTDVSLVIIDEIHLLGGDRGPILEVIVSRMKHISASTSKNIRVVGLSTALANASDLADWLGIGNVGLFNFRHSVRPVPLEIFIEGYPGKHYCPRMISMNKPTYAAIMTHSPAKPVIVFVSSRRQTRLTAQDLISFCANDDNPRRFLHMPEEEIEMLASNVRDQALKLALPFGIGLHHAGLVDSDRKLSEELFVNGKIQILIATSTLAWGVNFPAHLVVVKGTEFYDAKVKGYVDFPITDVLQMMGRAGRPQFDDSGVAVILVHDIKKNFYKKFLHEPFPVESSLHTCLEEHLNAEITSGSIKTKQDAMDYLSWTYLYRRVRMNPTFYGAEDTSDEACNQYLSSLIDTALDSLEEAECIEIVDDFEVLPTSYGKIASYYYLRYKTMGVLKRRLAPNFRMPVAGASGEQAAGDLPKLLRILSDVAEYDELPVRHNEDLLNRDLEMLVPFSAKIPKDSRSPFDAQDAGSVQYDSPHLKAFLLLQAHMSRLPQLPSIRVVQAMIDACVLQGFFATTLGLMTLLQCIKQARWSTDSTLLTLPHVASDMVPLFKRDGRPMAGLADFAGLEPREIDSILGNVQPLSATQRREISNVVLNLPFMAISYEIEGGKSKEGRWYVSPGTVYKVHLHVTRSRPYKAWRQIQKPNQVHAPRFPKPQSEGWWVMIGDERKNELWALKRARQRRTSNSPKPQRSDMRLTLSFETPVNLGEYDFDIVLASDGYLGLNQRQPLRICVVA